MGRRCPHRPEISWRICNWSWTVYLRTNMLQALQHILTECFLLHVCEAVYPFLSVCVYVHCMHGLSKEVCGKFSRGTGLGGSINKTAAMSDMPKPNKRSWKDAGRTPRIFKSREQGEKKGEGRHRFHHYFSNLMSDRGQEHGFQRVKKAVTISGKNHEVLICWVMGWVVVSHVLLIWREHLLACQSAGSLMLFMDVHKSSSYSISARLWYSTCVQQRSPSRFVRHKAVCIRRQHVFSQRMWQSEQPLLEMFESHGMSLWL